MRCKNWTNAYILNKELECVFLQKYSVVAMFSYNSTHDRNHPTYDPKLVAVTFAVRA